MSSAADDAPTGCFCEFCLWRSAGVGCLHCFHIHGALHVSASPLPFIYCSTPLARPVPAQCHCRRQLAAPLQTMSRHVCLLILTAYSKFVPEVCSRQHSSPGTACHHGLHIICRHPAGFLHFPEEGLRWVLCTLIGGAGQSCCGPFGPLVVCFWQKIISITLLPALELSMTPCNNTTAAPTTTMTLP